MPKIPSKSPVTGTPLPTHYIHTLSSHFVDQSSRVRVLRGVNLCGSSKTPVGKPSWILDGFWEAVEAADGDSFVGRPLELTKDELRQVNASPFEFAMLGDPDEADIHLARLRGWGFTLLRFVFTWEALEHAGPGKYDEPFITHLILVLQKCKEHGFLVFLDPHQDVWSRFTGGSGAPYWTLLACGINPRSITATQASLIQNEYPVPADPDPEAFPAMIWGTNYSRLACQTLFTLFFAGRDFAPKCIIDGVNIQDYLQSHFINAVAYLAKRIREAGGLLDECVIGWDSLNEPHEGLVGYEDLRKIPSQQALKKGSSPTVAQSLRLCMGRKQEDIEWWDFGSFGPRRNGSVDIDPKGVKLWVDEDVADERGGVNGRWGWKRDPEWTLGECVWALHGVWDPEPTAESTAASRQPPISARNIEEDKDKDILLPGYFLYKPSDAPAQPNLKVNFIEDYFVPHIRLYFSALREYHPELIPFIQPPVFHPPPWLNEPDPEDPSSDLLHGRGCFSTHYYDGLTLMTKHWNWFNADALGVLRGKYGSPVLAVKIGDRAIRKSIREQLGVLKADCSERMGAYPTVFGEIGVPMDMDDKYAYGGRDGTGKGKGDYREHVKALDASLYGADGDTMCGFTLWTYCSDGSHKWGDGWNGEDLSLWCIEDERTSGSITGRKEVIQQQPVIGVPSGRAEKGQPQMIIRPVTDEGDDQEVESADGDSQSLKPGGMTGYQVSSASITLEDILQAKFSSPPMSFTSPANPPSSKATLIPTHENTDHKPGPSTLSFPTFKSAPLAFAFLTNGARAWKAFVRAYPLAIVGLPIGWEWDITRAVFELKVRVGPNDRAGLPSEGVDVEDASASFIDQEEATEIFVPLLHFAKDDIVKRAFGIPVSPSRLPGSDAAPTPGAVPLLNDASTVSLSMDSTKAQAFDQAIELSAASGSGSRETNLRGQEEVDMQVDDALDLEVAINAGRWDVEGQVLKWWYPIPTGASSSPTSHLDLPSSKSFTQVSAWQQQQQQSSSQSALAPPKRNPDGTVEYTITIRRRGGAINFKRLGVPENWVGMGPKENGVQSRRRKGGGDNGKEPTTWCDCCLIA